jgi:hypothetical protein
MRTVCGLTDESGCRWYANTAKGFTGIEYFVLWVLWGVNPLGHHTSNSIWYPICQEYAPAW